MGTIIQTFPNGGSGDTPVSANDVTYDNTTSGLTADDVQEAIDEVSAEKIDKTSISSIESTNTASSAHAEGSYFINASGQLVKATSAIAVSDTIILKPTSGYNTEATNVIDVIGDINSTKISKSNTSGLVKNDGSIDTESYTDEIDAIVNVYGGKNLLVYPYYDGNSRESYGITFTVDENGVVTANGSYTSEAYFDFYNPTTGKRLDECGLEVGHTYTLSGGTLNTVFLYGSFRDSSNNQISSFNTNNSNMATTFTVPNNAYSIHIGLAVWASVSNEKVYPMLRDARITDSTYVPYAKTNKELTKNVGNISDLITFNKTSLVKAVNEIEDNTNGIVRTNITWYSAYDNNWVSVLRMKLSTNIVTGTISFGGAYFATKASAFKLNFSASQYSEGITYSVENALVNAFTKARINHLATSEGTYLCIDLYCTQSASSSEDPYFYLNSNISGTEILNIDSSIIVNPDYATMYSGYDSHYSKSAEVDLATALSLEKLNSIIGSSSISNVGASITEAIGNTALNPNETLSGGLMSRMKKVYEGAPIDTITIGSSRFAMLVFTDSNGVSGLYIIHGYYSVRTSVIPVLNYSSASITASFNSSGLVLSMSGAYGYMTIYA